MVTQTTFNPAVGNYNYQYPPLANNNIANSNPLIGNGNLLTTDYSDDIMMSNIDFSNPSTLQPAAQQAAPTATPAAPTGQSTGTITQPQQSQVPTFTSNPQEGASASELDNYLVTQDNNLAVTENGNAYKKSNNGKTIGTIAGFLAPIGSKLVSLFKGGNIKNLFKFKQLAIVCPALALAGFGIGALVDGFFNSKKAQAADSLAQQQSPAAQQTAQPQINTIA